MSEPESLSDEQNVLSPDDVTQINYLHQVSRAQREVVCYNGRLYRVTVTNEVPILTTVVVTLHSAPGNDDMNGVMPGFSMNIRNNLDGFPVIMSLSSQSGKKGVDVSDVRAFLNGFQSIA